MFSVVIARVGTCAHDAGDARLMSTEPACCGKHVSVYFYFAFRYLKMPGDGAVYHSYLVGEATAGTVKVYSIESIGC